MNRVNRIIGGAVIAAASITALAMVITIFSRQSSDEVIIKFQNQTEISATYYSENYSESAENSQNKRNTEKTTHKSTSKNSGSYNKNDENEISFPINLNTATIDELCEIDGIGEVTAQKIINLRENLGGSFKNRYQLLEVDGIGEKKLDAIWEYLYIENEEFDETMISETYPESEILSENFSEKEIEIESDISQISETLCIDLNSASYDELIRIPCIDENLCNEILSLREEIGYFSDTHELLYATGMTEKIYTEIEKYVFVENRTDTAEK